MLRRMRACEAIFDGLVDAGLNDEAQEFEDILWAAVDCATFEPKEWKQTLEPLEETALRVKKPRMQVFFEWEYFVRGCGVESLVQMFENVVELGRKAIEDGISAEEGSRRGADAADGAEPACDADVSCYRAAGGRCAAAYPGSDQEERVGYGAEDEETETDRILRAIGFRSDGPCREEVGVPREEPREPSDAASCVEGREASSGGLAFTAERCASLRAQGLRL